jgi:hypothetical protein
VDVVKEAAERKVVAAEQVKVVDSLVAAKAAGREVSYEKSKYAESDTWQERIRVRRDPTEAK